MRDDFCAFILSHGRPDNVDTWGELEAAGYTGRRYIVLDDEDPTANAYRARYGAENVLTFSKKEVAQLFDEGENDPDRRTVVYARNACWELARQVGARHFIQLDDDYFAFAYRYDSAGRWKWIRIRETMDDLLDAMLDYLLTTPSLTVAMSQGGDHIGGAAPIRLKRKAMNSFVCTIDRPFMFRGRINEDVNTYVEGSRRGELFMTVMSAMLVQRTTQGTGGGMTETYVDGGTYLKTFPTVMRAPSCVKVSTLGDPGAGGPTSGRASRVEAVAHHRIHHRIDWTRCAPRILREEHRKPRQ